MSDTYSRSRSPTARPLLAVILFLAVYAAALVVLFAPKDLIGALPGSSVTAETK